MARITDVKSLYDFIGYVVLCAPSNFPRRDYLPVDEQMNLERAFTELQNGIVMLENKSTEINKDGRLSSFLAQSLSLYKAGNEVEAAQVLHQFQNEIFRN